MTETATKIEHTLIRIFQESELTDFLNMSYYDYGVVQLFDRKFYILEYPSLLTEDAKNGLAEDAKNGALKDRLLITDGLNESTERFLRKTKVNFCDTAGNLHLCIGDMTMDNYAKIDNPKMPTANLMTEAALKVILAILANYELIGLPIRHIAAFCGVSVGTVQRVIEVLKQNQIVFETGKGRCLKNRKELLEIWVRGFNMVLKPKYTLGTAEFRKNPTQQSIKNEKLPEGVFWGGEPYAFLVDGYLAPETYSLYTTYDYKETCRVCGLVPMPGGRATVFKRFWNDEIDSWNTTRELVAYAELMGSGNSRCIDAAKRLMGYE